MAHPTAELVFGHTIQAWQHRRALSQEELAERCDLHRTTLSQIERGLKSPSLRVILALAAALQVQAHVLVRETEKEFAKK